MKSKKQSQSKRGKPKTVGKYGYGGLPDPSKYPTPSRTGLNGVVQPSRGFGGLADPAKYPPQPVTGLKGIVPTGTPFRFIGTKDTSANGKFNIPPISRGIGQSVSDIARNRTDVGGIGSTVREMAQSQNTKGSVVDDIIGGSKQTSPTKYTMSGFAEKAQKMGDTTSQTRTYFQKPVMPSGGFSVPSENAPKALGKFGKKKSKKSRRK